MRGAQQTRYVLVASVTRPLIVLTVFRATLGRLDMDRNRERDSLIIIIH